MRSLWGTVFSVAVHNVGREKLYLSTDHRIRILYSSSPGGNRVLFLASAQKLIHSKGIFVRSKKEGFAGYRLEIFFTEMN